MRCVKRFPELAALRQCPPFEFWRATYAPLFGRVGLSAAGARAVLVGLSAVSAARGCVRALAF